MYTEFQSIIKQSDPIKEALRWLNSIQLPNAFVCAGCLQQTVFNHLHGYDISANIKDIDIAFFDSNDLSSEYEQKMEEQFLIDFPGINIKPDIKNQARVHLWYKEKFGRGIEPYIDIFHAIDTFPTTSTTIGIRATRQSFNIYSTFGLSDLMSIEDKAEQGENNKRYL